MIAKIMRVGLVFLVTVLLLTGLCHFCATDRVSDSSATHVCAICATTGIAVVSSGPELTLVTIEDRLESQPVSLGFDTVVTRITSPRAPPAL
jgi:hypothetical protein